MTFTRALLVPVLAFSLYYFGQDYISQYFKPSGNEDENPLPPNLYGFTVNDINGNPVTLEKYRGHVLLIVNLASQCGLTSQNYQELIELDERFRESKGLRILGFPCNQFLHQEPGTSKEILTFAKSKNARFDIFEKLDVNGETAHPLYKYLKSKQPGLLVDSIKWNFEKFIVDENGVPVGRFSPTTSPLELVAELEKYWLPKN